MATVYSISLGSTSATSGGSTTVYGVYIVNGQYWGWPTTLTSVSIAGAPAVTSISPIVVFFSNADGGTSGGDGTYGQPHSGTIPVPWPLAATGVFTPASAEASTSSSPSAPASTTSTSPSITVPTTSGKTALSNAPVYTGSVTSKLPTSASTSTPTVKPSAGVSSPSPGISTGATAGIAIGCALLGLAIGFLAAFCLVQRKGKRNSSAAKAGGAYREPEAAYHASEKASPSPVSEPRLEQFFLLEATPDRTIAQETQSISALIDQHVESYYHSQPVTVDAQTLSSSLAHLGFPLTATSLSTSLLDAQSAAAVCLDPRSRRVGLRHVITRVLLDSVDVRSPRPSLLPAPVASFLRAMPAEETDRFGDPQANALALREWRRLSAFLLHPSRSQRTALPAEDAAVAAQAWELAGSLNAFLGYFVEEQQRQQAGHLQAVIEECAKLGCMLFSHPSDWEFVYETGAPGVVVEAGLCKLQGRDGAGSPCSQMVTEPVVVSL